VAVDTLGRIGALMVVPASTQDRVGGIALVERLRSVVRRIPMLWGDSHFDTARTHAWCRWGWAGVVVKKWVGQVGFVVQPKRWIVERTFGGLNRSRRLSKDYERTIESSEAFVKVAMIHRMARRLKREDPTFLDTL
jgi:putative transposase